MPPRPQARREWSVSANIILPIIWLALNYYISTSFSDDVGHMIWICSVLCHLCMEMWKEYKERMAERDDAIIEWRPVGVQRRNGRNFVVIERVKVEDRGR